ncbi:MAG TPA: hypothetical protein VJ734_06455 [Nitrosospira sp.]|nr:hypothetical protein [Nitrosospira sp.]
MNRRVVRIIKAVPAFILAIVLAVPALSAQAECEGCLCPGNPCKLCPLPPAKGIPPAKDEPDTCRKIRENAPPVSKNTDPDEHYASLDKSIMECVRNGGDVVMNSRRNEEFPFKHYCKPYMESGKAGTGEDSSGGKNRNRQ